MAKLGWVPCAMVLVLIFGVAATRPATDDSAKLDEIKALLEESLRLQRIDLHRRTYKEHSLFKNCDFDEKCKDFESRAWRHNSDRGPEIGALGELYVNGVAPPRYFHPFTGDCGGLPGAPNDCKKAEEAYREANKDKMERMMKFYERRK